MKKNGRIVIWLMMLGIAVLIVIEAVVGGDDGAKNRQNRPTGPLPGNTGVYLDILNETDCGALQATFDRAMANYDRGISKKIVMSYAEAAHRRMGAICY